MKFTRSRVIFSFAITAIAVLVVGCSQAPDTSASSTQATPAGTTSTTDSGREVEDILVTVTVQSAGVTELALPINAKGKRLPFSEVAKSSGEWTETFGGDRIQSTKEGSTVSFHVSGADPIVAFLQNPNGAEVSISYDGTIRTISLHGDKYDWRPEHLKPVK